MCENLRSECNGIDDFSPFIHQGVLTLDPKSDVKFEVRILRDTRSNQTVVSKRVCQALGLSLEDPEQYAMLKTVTGRTTLPVVSVNLDSELYTGLISVAVVEEMPLNVVAASWPMTSCRTLPARLSYRVSWLIHDVLPREKAWKMIFRVA